MAFSAKTQSSTSGREDARFCVWTPYEHPVLAHRRQFLANPFPLLPDGQGGYSNIRNSILFDAAPSTALLTMGVAMFGRGAPRLLLAGSGFTLAIVAYGAVLQNGV
jgi:hypothetical protein